MNLAWQDHAIVLAYLGFALLVGLITSQRQHSNDEYFLGRRELPWWALGLSLLATLLPGIGTLLQPDEITPAALMTALARMMAVPVTLAVTWMFAIPFLKRFRITSLYEYLEYRFNYPTRLLGVGLFVAATLSGLVFVIHNVALRLSQGTGISISLLIAALGIVTTVYVVMGGLRAIVWTSSVQMVLMLGGGLLVASFIASRTNSTPLDWYQQATAGLQAAAAGGEPSPKTTMTFFDSSLVAPSSVLTVALSLLLWQLCMHCGNQSTVQRYLAADDVATARGSLLLASLGSVGGQLLILALGLGLLFWTTKEPAAFDTQTGALTAAAKLPPGMAGALLTAVLSGAMALLASGLNSLATVLCIETERRAPRSRYSPGADESRPDSDSLLATARWITFIAGAAVTLATFACQQLSGGSVVIDLLSRALPCLLAPLGATFLIGLFFPFVTGRAMFPAALIGVATGVSLTFTGELWGFRVGIDPVWTFPSVLWTTALFSVLFSLLDRPKPQQTFGLTVFTQQQEVLFDVPMDTRKAA